MSAAARPVRRLVRQGGAAVGALQPPGRTAMLAPRLRPPLAPRDAPAAAPPAAAAGSLGLALRAALLHHAKRPALCCHGRRLRYDELDAASRALAAFWQQRGLVVGDRLAVMLPGGLPLPVVVLSAWRAGLVLVPIDPALSGEALVHQLRDSGARALVAGAGATAALAPVLEQHPVPCVVVAGVGELLGPVRAALVRRQQRVQAVPLPGAVPFGVALDRGRVLPLAEHESRPDDIAVLQYTGGTTGVARGVVLLHGQLLANLHQAERWLQPALAARPLEEPWTTVAALPLHHVFGFTLALLLTLHRGGQLLLVPDWADTDALAALLQRERFHLFPSLNPVFEALARHPAAERIDWSGLRLSLAGGLAVDPATAMLWLLKTGSPIIQGYGLAECSPAVTCNRVDDSQFSGHVGYPLPDTEVRLVDAEGRPVPPGASGEVVVRGPQVMAGYWQRPDETARVMLPGGWLRTGDLGRFEPDGALVLIDRLQDIVWVGGLPVVPNQVEEIVENLPGVRECAAVGVPNAEAGEVVKLVVVRADPAAEQPTEAQLRAHCERHLAGYQRPVHVVFSARLPRSGTGKVLRRALRAAP
ncbi:MAG: AMP-binding protein [Betaproteobacteria bacterium]